MDFDTNKKVLFVTGTDNKLQQVLRQTTDFNLDNILFLQIYDPVISGPYSDLMRDIILAVYQENVEEIFVVGSTDQENKVESQNLLDKIYENEDLLENLQVVEYLFRNCTPRFSGSSVTEWLAGSKTLPDGVQKSVNIIRNHPLIPSHVKVQGLQIDLKTGKLSELNVSQDTAIR